MFINAGARAALLQAERQRFLEEEWPRVQATIQRLGLNAGELLNGRTGKAADAGPANITAAPAQTKEEG